MLTRFEHKDRGFTLIELMVVISIIALLSAIILAALGNARIKAQNSSVTQEIQQYILAIKTYQDDHNGQYPPQNEPGYSQLSCLGKLPSGFSLCMSVGADDDPTLKNALEPYIPGWPTPNPVSISLTWDTSNPPDIDAGAVYHSMYGDPAYPDDEYSAPFILWGLQGSNADCVIPGSFGQTPQPGDGTFCQIDLTTI